MSTKIAIMSPLHQSGATTVSAIMAHALAYKGFSSLLCYTESNNPVSKYFGVKDVDDPTRSVMLVTKLIEAGALKDTEIKNYAYMYDKRSYLMNIADNTLDARSRRDTIKYTYNRVDTDFVICDISTDITDEQTQELLDVTDAVFIVINPYNKYFDRIRGWLAIDTFNGRDNTFVLVNNYNEIVYAMRDISKKIGIKAVNLCKMHYNPWITKCCEVNKLQTIMPCVYDDNDSRVLNLRNDIKEITDALVSVVSDKIQKQRTTSANNRRK